MTLTIVLNPDSYSYQIKYYMMFVIFEHCVCVGERGRRFSRSNRSEAALSLNFEAAEKEEEEEEVKWAAC